MIAPETSAEEALVLAERLRAAAAAALDQLALPGTLSAGVTDLTQPDNARSLPSCRQRGLYHAKHHGRDRVELYTPGVENDPAAQDSHRRLIAHTGIAALLRASDAKDAHTSRHSERVANIAAQLAARRGWPAERCGRLHEAARLHDLGKIGVPDGILRKPCELTAEEYERVKTHARLGAQIAAGVLDAEQVSWIDSHHERPDGQGYPDALTAPDIPDGALIIATADAYDAITTGRSYRAAISPTDAIAEMRRHTGTQFDATLIDTLEDWARHHENGAGRDAARRPTHRSCPGDRGPRRSRNRLVREPATIRLEPVPPPPVTALISVCDSTRRPGPIRWASPELRRHDEPQLTARHHNAKSLSDHGAEVRVGNQGLGP